MEIFSALLALCEGNPPVTVFPLTKANNAELWCFLSSVPEQTVLCRIAKFLQFIWRSGTRRFLLRMPGLQVSCSDLIPNRAPRQKYRWWPPRCLLFGLCKETVEESTWSRSSWWRHQMETFSALLIICAGNSPVPGTKASDAKFW